MRRQPTLKVVVPLAQEIHLELVALDRLVTPLLALELLLAPPLADRLSLVFRVIVVGLGDTLVVFVLVLLGLGRLLDDHQIVFGLVVFLQNVSHRSSPFR